MKKIIARSEIFISAKKKKPLHLNGNKGKFISKFKSQEIKNSVTTVFTRTITCVIIANTKSVVATKKRGKSGSVDETRHLQDIPNPQN